jgi:hypothetical protein
MATPIMPMIRGEVYGWSSVRCVILGKSVVTISNIEYNTTQEMESVYGVGEHKIGIGLGNKEHEGSITLKLEEVLELIAISPSKYGHLQDIPFFDVIVSFQPKEGGGVVTHILENCKFKETNISVAQNDKEVEVELPLFIGNVNYKA